MRNYKSKLDGLDRERGNRLAVWHEKAQSMLSLPDENFTRITRALFEWFTGGNDQPLANKLENAMLEQLKDDQRRAVAALFERCETLKANRTKRGYKGLQGATNVTPCSTRGYKGQHTNTDTDTNTNTKTPPPNIPDGAAAAFVSLFEYAERVTGGTRGKAWLEYCQRNGAATFKRLVDTVKEKLANGERIKSPAGWLTSKCQEDYRPAPRPEPEQSKPMVITIYSRELCADCQLWKDGKCTANAPSPDLPNAFKHMNVSECVERYGKARHG